MTVSAQPERYVPGGRPPLGSYLVSALRRSVGLLCVWLVLSGAPPGIWLYALPATGLAVGLSLRLLPPQTRRASIPRLLVLLPVFAWYALRGGVDVAGRALRPSMPLDTGFVTVELDRISPTLAVALGYVITLLPGSLAVRIDGSAVELHVLDRHLPIESMVYAVEGWLSWALEPQGSE